MKNGTGFIGLGQMGKNMVVNIQKKGFSLWVYDLRQAAMDELVQWVR